MEPKELLTAISLAIALVILGVFSALIIGAITDSSALQCTDLVSPTNDTVLTELTQTLAPIGDGITSSSVTGKEFTWLEFDGVNDFVETGVTDELDNKNWSISLWFKGTQCYTQNNLAGKNFVFWARGNSRCQIEILNQNFTAVTKEAETVRTYQNDTWTYLYYEFNGSHVSVYMNNTFEADVAIENIRNNSFSDEIKIGGNINGAYGTWGIDEVRFYNRTLTPAQRTAVYDSGRIQNSSINSSGLVLWMPFNEGEGQIAHDLSGGGFNGI